MLFRSSIDARKKRDVHFILGFRVELTSPHLEREAVDSVTERDRSRVRAIEDDGPSFPSPVSDAPQERPVVVGAGCAGLFAALTLAEAGLKPLLIERGDNDRDRKSTRLNSSHQSIAYEYWSSIRDSFGNGS